MNTDYIENLIEKAWNQNDKWAIGRLISIFENQRQESIQLRSIVLKALSQKKENRKAQFIGFTGAPGVGKSSLVASLTKYILQHQKQKYIAVVAVDPSSSISGGAFLGDRERLHSDSQGKERLFFRSQANEQQLGGMGPNSFIVSRLLYYLFDFVFLETVGIGQSETEIQFLADCTILLLQPSSGDHIQFLKAGVMEIPDLFVLNKCDQNTATQQSFSLLKTSLPLFSQNKGNKKDIPIILTSTYTGEGINTLAQFIFDTNSSKQIHTHTWIKKEEHYFIKWVKNEFGERGLKKLQEEGNTARFIKQKGSFEEGQLYCLKNF